MADGATLSDQDLWSASAAPPPAEVINPTPVKGGMSYDEHYGIVRAPDGSIQDITKVFGSGHADPTGIQSFLQAFPEDIANRGHGTAGQGTGPAAPAAPASNQPLSDKDLFPDLLGAQAIPQTPAMQAAQHDVAVRQIATPAGAFANGIMYGFQPDLLAGGVYVKTAIGNALDRLKGQEPKYSAGEAAGAEEQAVREAQTAYSQTHPVSNAALGIGGSFANPLTYVGGDYLAGAPTVLGMMGRGAQLGAVTGAIQGIGAAGGDLYQRAIGAAQGGALGFLTGGLTAGAARGLGSMFRSSDITAAQTAAHEALSRTGINPKTLPPEAQTALNSYLAQGRNPSDSAFAAIADTLPTRQPISVGQMSADPALQWTENLALRGGAGQGATTAASAFRDVQQRALQSNVEDIGTGIAGAPIQPGEGGTQLSKVLNARRDQMSAGVNQAYEAAREAPGALLPADHAADLARSVRYGVHEYDPRNIPKVTRELRNLEQALAERPATPAPEAPAVSRKAVPVSQADLSKYSPAARTALEKALGREGQGAGADVRAIFDARARLTHLTQDSDRVTAGAARKAVRQLDQAIDDAVSESLFTGDRKAVDLWREAIGKRRVLGRLFEGDDLIDKLTERMERGGEHNALRVDPVDATNYILGRQGLVGLGRANATRDIKRLGDVIGRDSPAWKAMKGEVFHRLAMSGEGPSVAGQPMFSGAKFASNWRAAKAKYGSVIDQMFTPDERGLIDRFAVTAERITKPVPGGDNPSNSAVGVGSILRGMRRLPFIALKDIPGLGMIAQHVEQAANARTIQRATVGARPRYVPTPANALAGTVGYAASNQVQRSALEGLHH